MFRRIRKYHTFFTVEEIDRAFDPKAYLGSTKELVERALASYSEMKRLISEG